MRRYNLPNLTSSFNERMALKRRQALADTLVFAVATIACTFCLNLFLNASEESRRTPTLSVNQLLTTSHQPSEVDHNDLIHWLQHLEFLSTAPTSLVSFNLENNKATLDLHLSLAEAHTKLETRLLAPWQVTHTKFQYSAELLPLTQLEFQRRGGHD